MDLTVEDLPEVTSEPEAAPPSPPAFRHAFSWLVQLRDGRVLRVDADSCDASNGVLVFRGSDNHMLAVFEYGDWKRCGLMNRETGDNVGWHVVKEREKRK